MCLPKPLHLPRERTSLQRRSMHPKNLTPIPMFFDSVFGLPA
jgi:hypothetical protein